MRAVLAILTLILVLPAALAFLVGLVIGSGPAALAHALFRRGGQYRVAYLGFVVRGGLSALTGDERTAFLSALVTHLRDAGLLMQFSGLAWHPSIDPVGRRVSITISPERSN